MLRISEEAVEMVVRLLNKAWDHDCGGDVFGLLHNDTTDMLIACERAIAHGVDIVLPTENEEV